MFPKLSNLEYAILDVLRYGRDMYGLEIVKESDGRVKRGSVYVTLARMSEKEYVTMKAEEDANHPGLPRHRYKITGHGDRVLKAADAAGAVMGGAVFDV